MPPRGSEDIALTARGNYYEKFNLTKGLPLVVSSGGQTETTTMHLSLKAVYLEYFEQVTAGKYVTPGDPKMAYLHVEMTYTIDADPDHTVYRELGSPALELTDANGNRYLTKNLVPNSDLAYEVFAVPADFTDGQLTFGAGSENFSDGSSEDIPTPLTVPVHIPAG